MTSRFQVATGRCDRRHRWSALVHKRASMLHSRTGNPHGYCYCLRVRQLIAWPPCSRDEIVGPPISNL